MINIDSPLNLILEVDNREPNTIKSKLEQHNGIQFKNLDLGDFIIKNGVNTLLIIERKSISDLLSSIKDTRYKNQLYRYNQIKFNNSKIIFIIEGNRLNYPKNSSEYKTINSAIFTIMYIYNFKVIFTQNTQETIEFIINIYNNMDKYINASESERESVRESERESVRESESESESETITQNPELILMKKPKIQKEDIDKYILNLIPGIGLTTSTNILRYFNDSFLTLVNEYKINKDLFKNFTIQNKKLSKNIIINLNEFIEYLVSK